MESSLHKHQVVEGIRSYMRVTFRQLAQEDTSLRTSSEFRNKNFRKVSLSASVLYLLKKLQKCLPFPDYTTRVGETLQAHLQAPFLLEMLEKEYPNKVQRSFELLALELITLALLPAQAASEIEGRVMQQLDALTMQSEIAGYEASFAESRLLRPLLNDAGWQLFTPEGVMRLAHLFQASSMQNLFSFAQDMACKLEKERLPSAGLINLTAPSHPSDRKSFLLDKFIRPHADKPPTAAAAKMAARPEVPRPDQRIKPAIRKQPQRSLKFCFEPQKLVRRRRPFPKWESLVDLSTLRSLQELECGATTCASKTMDGAVGSRLPSCGDFAVEEEESFANSIDFDLHSGLF